MTKSVCFVLMPFGVKPDASGRAIDFDQVYRLIYKPAIERAGLLPIRADEEQSHGFIHKLMYERLLLSEYAIADVTILNANVYYELGVRHAARPATTIMAMAEGTGLPFDIGGLRAFVYPLDADGRPRDAGETVAKIGGRLQTSVSHDLVDSPLYQLVDALQPPPIDRERTDVFRERAAYSEAAKAQLAAARAEGKVEAVAAAEQQLGAACGLEAGVAIDLMLSYRAVGGFAEIVELVKRMDQTLAQTVLVREQLGFAQNRLGQSREAETTLKQIIKARGPSTETNGLLGRVYKDRWEKAAKSGDVFGARSLLKQAIEAYLEGFETDWRDAYPGINAVTLMEIADDASRHALVPVVRYAVERRLARKGQPDYWDYATRLELAILGDDANAACDALGDAITHVREKWELETTARNLRLIAEARAAREADHSLVDSVLAALSKRIETWGS